MPPPNYVVTSEQIVHSNGSIDAEYTDDINASYRRITLVPRVNKLQPPKSKKKRTKRKPLKNNTKNKEGTTIQLSEASRSTTNDTVDRIKTDHSNNAAPMQVEEIPNDGIERLKKNTRNTEGTTIQLSEASCSNESDTVDRIKTDHINNASPKQGEGIRNDLQSAENEKILYSRDEFNDDQEVKGSCSDTACNTDCSQLKGENERGVLEENTRNESQSNQCLRDSHLNNTDSTKEAMFSKPNSISHKTLRKRKRKRKRHNELRTNETDQMLTDDNIDFSPREANNTCNSNVTDVKSSCESLPKVKSPVPINIIHMTKKDCSNPLLNDESRSQSDTDSDDGFDADQNDLRPKYLSNFPSSYIKETPTKFEESYNTYYGKDQGIANSRKFDTSILQHGIDLDDDYVEQIGSKEFPWKDFYKQSVGVEHLENLCLKDPKMYKKCTIQIKSPHLAICKPLDSTDRIEEITVNGRSKCCQTFTEDKVVVQLSNMNFQNTTEDEKKLNGKGERDTKMYGEVVGILERIRFKNIRNPVFVCVIDRFEGHLMKPLCKTVPKIRVKNSRIMKKYPKYKKHKVEEYKFDRETGKLVFKHFRDIEPADRQKYIFLVVFICWNTKSIYPLGAVIKVLLSEEDISTGLEIIGLQHQVPSLYQKNTVDCVRELVEDMPNGEISPLLCNDRKDFSSTLNVFTIDPPHARDLDDALSLERNLNGVFKVGVHIADVASIIKKGNSIDNEARERVVTFYPGQDFRAFHMLPEPLSNLCSLLPGKKRLTLSIFFKFDANGKIMEPPEIQKTIIKSMHQFTYKEAWDIIVEQQKPIEKLHIDIKDLYALAYRIRKLRLRDAMNALPVEVDDEIDSDSILKTLEAHWLVEEYMILANKYIGNYMRSKLPDSTLLRCQDAAPFEKMESWEDMHPYVANIIFHLQNKRISVEKELALKHTPNARYSNYIPLQKWVWSGIEEAMDSENPISAWNLLSTDQIHPEQAIAYEEWIQIQESAEYRCSGTLKDNGKYSGHFSLNVSNYAHFTSPIRRYSDIVVQRQLHSILNEEEKAYSKNEIDSLCSHINTVSKNAKAYHKQCDILHLAHDLKNNPKYFHAFVQEVSDSDVKLYFPGIRKVPKRYRTIQFRLLDVCSKPTLEDDIDLVRPKELGKRKRVVVKWQKRLYKHSGYSRNTREENAKCFSLDPHKRASFLRFKDFVSMLRTVPIHDNKYLRELFLNIRDDVNSEVFKDYVNSCRLGVADVSSEVKKGLITNHRCEFTLSLHINQIVAVQMSAEPRLGLLVPSPQIFDISDNFKCCLRHVNDPVKTLVKYATTPTKESYRSLQEYINIWLPIIEMESATNAIKNEDSVTISNMPIEFKGRQGKMSHDTSYFDKRDIDLDAMSADFLKPNEEKEDSTREEEGNTTEKNKAVKDNGKYVNMASSDYICIRCSLPSPRGSRVSQKIKDHPDKKLIWVGHGKFTKVRKKKNGHVDVIFDLHSKSPDPPVSSMKSTDNVSIEILQKSKVDKRTETYLKMLDSSTSLAKAIALGRNIPGLDQQHLDIVATVNRGVPHFTRSNKEQLRAINMALKSRFSLIQGPPGTGKTFTGIKLIYIFNEFNTKLREQTKTDRKQIVFCGPSNKSVDLVARWMKEKLGADAPRMVRMYGKSFENLDFPVPGRALVSARTMRRSKVDETLSDGSLVLHRLIRENDKPFAEELRAFDSKFRGPPEHITLKDLKEYSKLLVAAKEAELKNHDVIFCTTSVAANPKFLEAVRGRIYQCIIDECGMCTEPESMVPIIGTQAHQIVLIGDHKQLRPVVVCRHAGGLGLETSLFERYANKKRHLTMLTKQYRMNPQICEFPSKVFYEGKLKTVDSDIWQEINPLKIWPWDFHEVNDPVKGHIPHLFCHIEGEEETLTVTTEEGNERSKSNMNEVHQVVKVFKYMMDVEKVNPDDINVISQYNSQCHAMKEAFLKDAIINVKINTVVASQGGEWDYVIFSTVRSLPVFLIESNPTEGWCKKNLGFITDHHQINVALTRARKGLIIIGNQNLLRCDEIWRQLIQDYSSCGCVKNAKTFPPPLPVRTEKAPRFQRKK